MLMLAQADPEAKKEIIDAVTKATAETFQNSLSAVVKGSEGRSDATFMIVVFIVVVAIIGFLAAVAGMIFTHFSIKDMRRGSEATNKALLDSNEKNMEVVSAAVDRNTGAINSMGNLISKLFESLGQRQGGS